MDGPYEQGALPIVTGIHANNRSCSLQPGSNTAIGAFNGSLTTVPATELGAVVPRAKKTEAKWFGTCQNVFTISCDYPLAVGQAYRLLTVRRGRRFGYVASIGFPITNHFSPITLRRANACSGQASHLSLFTFHQSPTLSLLTAALAA